MQLPHRHSLAPGAQKKFYSGIYTADPASDVIDWTLAAEMPAPMAYGHCDCCLGRSAHRRKQCLGLSTDVYHFDGTALTALPSLPYGIDNAPQQR